jgi:hypothetical protein
MSGISNFYQVNDKVVFLHEKGEGIVTKIENGLIFVLDDTGFERPFHPNHISRKIGEMSTDRDPISPKEQLNFIGKESKSTQANVPFIDLHIESLVESTYNWTNHEILSYQLSAFRRFLSTSESKKDKRIVVIHGMGNGVLKQHIREYLDGSGRYSYRDADFDQFGFGGATQIDIRLNWKD